VPGLLDKAVNQIAASGVKKSSAYPIAVAALQKPGSLKQGSLKPTTKGVKRSQMTRKERAATR
jgi:hypothetical protein